MKKRICLFGFLLLAGCGTDTGNPPFSRISIPTGEILPLIAMPDFLPDQICKTLSRCGVLKTDDCKIRVNAAANLSTAAGANPVLYPTWGNVIAAFPTRPDPAEDPHGWRGISALTCNNALERLTCSDPLIALAYDPSQPDQFDQTFRFLEFDPSCKKLVGP